MVRRVWIVVFACACAEGGTPATEVDARTPDAACTMKPFYTDSDGDLHGDPNRMMMACEAPTGTVAANDDCDDTTAQRAPGLAEVCDAIDNDCNTGTVETCPAGCSPLRRPAPDDKKVYLFCSGVTSWAGARQTCATAQFKLVQIEDAAENGYIRSTANLQFGAIDLHIGGSDSAAEGNWVWDGSDAFWLGGAGGAPVMNRYANWVAGEPNDDGTEDCAEMKPSGQWNDGSCGDGQRFVCRR